MNYITKIYKVIFLANFRLQRIQVGLECIGDNGILKKNIYIEIPI